MNETKGDMYPWCDYTWNPLAGRCPHDCDYCYMKTPPQSWLDKYQDSLRIYEKGMKQDLYEEGKGLTIFVCSGNDLFSAPIDDIQTILKKTQDYPENTYLFQTKNPKKIRMTAKHLFPENTIVGTTIESDRDYAVSDAPHPFERVKEMARFDRTKMVSIEPIMDFTVSVLVDWINYIDPDFVSIGADSSNNNLPEPSGDKVRHLYDAIKDDREIKLKKNLKRIWDYEEAE